MVSYALYNDIKDMLPKSILELIVINNFYINKEQFKKELYFFNNFSHTIDLFLYNQFLTFCL